MLIKRLPPIALMKRFHEQVKVADLSELIEELFELQTIYQAATKEVCTKLEILDDEFQSRHKRNPIHYIQRRVKSPDSILNKLSRKGFELSIDSARENLFDIAGIRVVCSYIDDIYHIAKLLKSQDDITIIREIDYIKDPKPNGYRSLHLVMKVPVFFSSHTEHVSVEVQIRTIAMDFWASLEHHLHYKASDDIPEDLSLQLKECADTIASTDLKMQGIHDSVERLYGSDDR